MHSLPRWVELGAAILAFVAGVVNAIGLLSFEHQSVSHLSGTATLLGTTLTQPNISTSIHLAGVLVAFLLGSALAGFLLDGSKLRLGRHYDTALVIEAMLLLGAMLLLNANSSYGHYFASAACGIQNALATNYSGAIVRTTHLTGIVTDLGIMVGQKLKGKSLDQRKAKLFLIIIAGFIVGAAAGSVLLQRFSFHALLLPIIICLALAATYRFYRLRSLGPA